MDTDHILRKLELQETPTILFTDLDGTLFSPNFNIITAPMYNSQIAAVLTKRHIPFVIVTGRSFWRKIDQYHLKLLGLPKPDAVMTANGTIIYLKQRENYISDFTWQGMMQSTKITDSDESIRSWNKWEITDAIITYFRDHRFLYQVGKGNTYLIRLRLSDYNVKTVEQIKKDILSLFPKGIKVTLTEKLLWKNTETVFSGELLITPQTAGKDKAISYFLKQLSKELRKPIHALIFGDATIDVPMLTMKEDPLSYTLSQYIVHPTPLAKKAIENLKDKPRLLADDGPREILWTLRPELRKEKVFSKAQNNKSRQVIRIFEGMLDNLVDKNLSANEVSFLGLKKLSEGLSLLHNPKSSLLDKTKGLYQYSFGNLTDILDGIRARRSKKEENGQLVDGFADRAKEFMQLFGRAKKRLSDEELALPTFLAAISCALPSIARAQVEINGKTVSERDERGGSMIDRTKRLFLSLLFDTLGQPEQSYAKDKEIFETNIATFQNRIKQARKIDEKKIDVSKLSDFEKKALERWLLYIDVLQQENILIQKSLSKNPKLSKEYEKESEKLAKIYLTLPITKLRKKWGITDYKLSVKEYIK